MHSAKAHHIQQWVGVIVGYLGCSIGYKLVMIIITSDKVISCYKARHADAINMTTGC